MANHSSLPRKLSSGIYGRMEFDFACNRGHGFGEAYLHGLLVELLTSNVNPREENILSSFAVPAIQRTETGRGRKREVDFVVAPRSDTTSILTCVEAKWAGSSHASEVNVLTDLARLALVHREHPDALCLFVLAGGKTSVRKLLGKGILAPNDWKKPARLLRYPYDGRPNSFYLNNVQGGQSALPAALRTKIVPVLPQIPDLIRSYLYKPAHDDPPDWSVHVWRVSTRS